MNFLYRDEYVRIHTADTDHASSFIGLVGKVVADASWEDQVFIRPVTVRPDGYGFSSFFWPARNVDLVGEDELAELDLDDDWPGSDVDEDDDEHELDDNPGTLVGTLVDKLNDLADGAIECGESLYSIARCVRDYEAASARCADVFGTFRDMARDMADELGNIEL